jgi:signal transduction histidine kinase
MWAWIEGGTAWAGRPGIGQRIALVMALSLVAIQLQGFAQIWAFARPEVRLVGTRWLAEVTRDAAALAFALPAEMREAALNRTFGSSDLRVAWTARPPWAESGDADHPLVRRLAATLRTLVDPGTPVMVGAQPLDQLFPFRRVAIVVLPPGAVEGFDVAPLPPGVPDVLMPAALSVAVQGSDGSWVSVTPVGFSDGRVLSALPLMPLMLGGIIICVVSIATARRVLSPLDRLVEVAGRIGTARALVRVPTEGLGEFAAVARAFEEVQRRLLRFDAERAQMLAAMSHDLRSALTRLRLAVEGDGTRDPDPTALREIEDMQAMVESTLAFASGAAAPSERRPLDLAALLISMVDDAADAGLPCTYAGPDHADVVGVPSALRRAFRNLVDNAVGYGTVARVTLHAGPSSVRVEIADEGPGIPPDRREEAFAPFRRLGPARGARQGGVGLGLTIARDIVQGHGGTIALRDRPERGLVVEVVLPVA